MNPLIAEYLGTFILLLMGNGVCANCSLTGTFAKGADWMLISFGWGLGVYIGVIKGTFCTSPAIKNTPRNVLSEVIGTFVLIFVVLFIAGPEFKLAGLVEVKIGLGSVGALPVALLVVAIGMSLGGLTGYAINPVRDLGPRIIHALVPIKTKGTSDWSYAWYLLQDQLPEQ